jgi:polysaccharide biosynthesis transport protein
MSANLPPLPAAPDSNLPVPADEYSGRLQPAPAYGPPTEEEGGGGGDATRLLSALLRFKWLIIGFAVAGLSGGIVASRFVEPEYEVDAAIFANPAGAPGNAGPVGSWTLTQIAGWKDLVRSTAIIDPVVQELALYVQPETAADSLVFAGFRLVEGGRGFRPGQYTLKTEGGRYSLVDKLGLINESGAVGDSVGRTAGFAWVPPVRVLGTKSRTVKFRVVTPREASRDIQSRFDVTIVTTSPVINVLLRGTAPQRPAPTLNAMLRRFTQVASELKTRELTQSAKTLGEQVSEQQAKLQDAERRLEDFRVATISKPSETPALIVPKQSNDGNFAVSQPVFGNYFLQKTQVETIRRDRSEVERLAKDLTAPNSNTQPELLLSIPTLAQDEGALPLRQVIKELSDEQALLRKDLLVYTDSNHIVIDRRRSIAELRNRVLPARLNDYLGSLRLRETELNSQLASATQELQEIPQRTIQQGALERERAVQSEIYASLRASYARANLAQQSAVPDVQVLDSAVMPSQPSKNTTAALVGVGLLAGLALGVVLAFILDRTDSRFRYAHQARDDLGLDVLGVVPVIDQSGRQSPIAVAQIVEAFRSIRMNVRYAAGGQRGLAFGITSPGPGDGKSLIASNLALSFAEGGWRTVIIDADTRRGELNNTFDSPATPGLVDYLEGTALLADVLYPTRHDNLTIVPCGTRHRRAPELLATPRMQQLVAALSAEFDAIIIDTPPLGAGTDAYAIGTACGQLALVLRNARTDVKMAKAKMHVLRSLPITMLGAILNEVKTDSGQYQYYSYDPEYVLPEETPALTAGAGGGTAVAER